MSSVQIMSDHAELIAEARELAQDYVPGAEVDRMLNRLCNALAAVVKERDEIDLARSAAEKIVKHWHVEYQETATRAEQAERECDEARRLLAGLAKCDPVYGPHRTIRDGKYVAIRICALCRAESADQAENITHRLECPWLPAVTAFRQPKGS